MTTADNKHLVRLHFEELFNKGNLDAVERIYTPDAIIHDPVIPNVPRGHEGVRQYLATYRGPVPDIHFEVRDIVGEEDTVAARWVVSGTHQGTLLAVPSTGRFGAISGHSIYRFEKGRIAESWTCWDVLGMLQALGLEIKLRTTPVGASPGL
jgi:steroid delta-isomerase-like uncharacterized protein